VSVAAAQDRSVRSKIGIVLGGYAAAFALATLAVAVSMAWNSGPVADASSGMHAFSDLLLFAAVFGAVGLLPTGLALVWLRPYRPFWTVLSVAAIVVGATGVIAVALFASGRSEPVSTTLGAWSGVAVLRILPAPLFAAAFLLAAVLCAYRTCRRILLATAGIEVLICLYAVVVWVMPLFVR